MDNEFPITEPEGDGWQNETPEDGGYFVSKFAGRQYQGLLLGEFSRNRSGKDETYYQVRLTRSSTVRNREGKEVEAEVGSVVNVDQTAGLIPLGSIVRREGEWEVFIVFVEKVSMRNGNSFWRVKIRSRRAGE
jgi:hypothetical protein